MATVRAAAGAATAPTQTTTSGSWQEALAAMSAAGDLTINTGSKELDKKVREKLDNPELFIYKLQNTAYKFAFLLVPLTLPFLWLLFFWKKNVTLFDHVVFSLYSLSFVTILVTLEVVASAMAPAATSSVAGVLMAAFPVHMYFQLKGGYALGWFSAFWRLVAMSMILTCVVGLFIFSIVALGALG